MTTEQQTDTGQPQVPSASGDNSSISPLKDGTPNAPAKKRIDWIKIGSYAGGVLSIPLNILLKVWRNGSIVVILFTFVCVGIGAAAGAGIEYLITKRR